LGHQFDILGPADIPASNHVTPSDLEKPVSVPLRGPIIYYDAHESNFTNYPPQAELPQHNIWTRSEGSWAESLSLFNDPNLGLGP
jgi:hypothetical protein